MPDKMFLNKQTYKYRWVVMSFSVWFLLGAYFCYDLPASLHNSLKEHMDNYDGDIFEIYFGGLYSIYSFANIFLPFISGGLRDILGDRFIIIFLEILVVLGQTIFTYGVVQKSFVIMYIGRIILGWGIESFLPTLTSFICPYYKEDYLAFSVGMNQFFATLGIVLCMLFCPAIAESQGLIAAVALGVFINVAAFFIGLVSVVLDGSAESQLVAYHSLNHQNEQNEQNEERKEGVMITSARSEYVQPDHQGFFSHAFSMKVVEQFPRLFWYMAIFYAIIFSSVLALANVSIGYFSEKWLFGVENPERTVAKMMAIMWLANGILTPIFGVLIDYFGHRSAMSILSASMCMMAHLLVILSQPLVGILFLGFALALAFATIWTGIVYVIPADQLGKAYGIIVALYNIGFSFVPLIVGFIRAYTRDYFYAQIFLAVLGLFALIFAILIYMEDHATGLRIDRGLNMVSEFHSTLSDSRLITNNPTTQPKIPVQQQPEVIQQEDEKKLSERVNQVD